MGLDKSLELDRLLKIGIDQGHEPRSIPSRQPARSVMADLSSVAARIAKKKQDYAAKADEWAQRLDKLDKVEPETFARGDAVINDAETDLAGFEKEMKDLGSNFPPLNGSDDK